MQHRKELWAEVKCLWGDGQIASLNYRSTVQKVKRGRSQRKKKFYSLKLNPVY